MINMDFQSILVLEDNGKQNPYTDKYQKHVACSYGYELNMLLAVSCRSLRMLL